MLVPRSGGKVRFHHPILEEALAGRELARRIRSPGWAKERRNRDVDPDRIREWVKMDRTRRMVRHAIEELKLSDADDWAADLGEVARLDRAA